MLCPWQSSHAEREREKERERDRQRERERERERDRQREREREREREMIGLIIVILLRECPCWFVLQCLFLWVPWIDMGPAIVIFPGYFNLFCKF